MIVYLATNKVSKKQYIGQTIYSLKKRIRGHFICAKIKNRCTYFQNALLKYGKENISWKILCYCNSIEELNEKETEMIREFNTIWPNGYNLTSGGKNNIVAEIVKRKISETMKRNQYGKGYKHTVAVKKKISDAGKGREVTEKTREKIRRLAKARITKEERKRLGDIGKKGAYAYHNNQGRVIKI